MAGQFRVYEVYEGVPAHVHGPFRKADAIREARRIFADAEAKGLSIFRRVVVDDGNGEALRLTATHRNPPRSRKVPVKLLAVPSRTHGGRIMVSAYRASRYGEGWDYTESVGELGSHAVNRIVANENPNFEFLGWFGDEHEARSNPKVTRKAVNQAGTEYSQRAQQYGEHEQGAIRAFVKYSDLKREWEAQNGRPFA